MKRLFTYILALSLLPQITSAAVIGGKTEGTFAVSAKGDATYTIPLTIMKGMSDFKPELSLFYDSNAESGIMGQGWSIKGMHAITKVSKCKHFDGTSQGTAYALDGMRLLETDDANGQLYYRTEYDRGDSISITSYQNNAPATFEVKTMDGCTYRYGGATGRYPLNRNVNQWALVYAQDALGNYISYTYDQNGGLYPTSITYGRNIHGTAGVDCTILFTYDSSTPKSLTKITCKYNENIYRSYTFEYENSPSYLTKITEGGRSTTTFAPTTFEWDNPTNPWVERRIISITDGLGATESYVYDNLNGTIYSPYPSFPKDSPFRELQHGERTVIVSRTESTPTDSRTTNYHYASGIYHKEGKGFLGFEEITARLSTGVRTETTRTLNENFCAFLPEDVIQYSHEWGQQLAWDFYDRPTMESAGGKAYRIKNLARVNSTAEGGYEEIHEDWYNTNGLLFWKRFSDGLVDVYDNVTAYWECPIDTIRIKGLPSEVTTRRYSLFSDYADDDEYEVYETTSYERDPNTGLILKETKRRSGELMSTNGYSYNEYGQVTRHWTVAYNSTDTLVTTYEYNAKGQLSKETNPLGQFKTYNYNLTTGMLLSVYDFNRAGTSYTYDNMLRETRKENNISSIVKTWVRADYGDGAYGIKVKETGKAPITTYYDAWNRKVAERTEHAYITTYTDYKYNSIGKVGFVSFPHKKTESDSLGTTYTYDDDWTYFLTRTEDSNGKIKTWEYESGRAFDITSCIDGVESEIDHILPDVLYGVYENGGSVQYTYNIDGNILKIISRYPQTNNEEEEDDLEKETNFKYDKCGRLIRITDENGVTKEFTYDANGYPKKVSIGNSFVETNYDKYGRLLSKTWKEENEDPHTVTYTYNTDLNKKHLVAKEQGDNYTYTYTYDTYGKLTGKCNSVSSDTQTEFANIGIQYSDRNISRKTCIMGVDESRSITESFSYTNNELKADTLNGAELWRITAQNRWGEVTRNSSIKYVFDDYGHMLSMKRNNLYPNYTALYKSFTYDLQTGNMVEKDSVSYTYDNMNRLTGWGEDTFAYDNKGNITQQPYVGDFAYENFRLKEFTEASDFHCDDSLKISYYQALGRPKSIKNDNYMAEFSYDGDGNRILMKVYKKVSGQYQPYLTRYYLDENVEVNVDSVGNRAGFYYANGDRQTASEILVVKPNSNYNSWRVIRDNTGSIFQYERGYFQKHYFSYNPWGVRTTLDDPTNFYKPGDSLGDCPFYRTYRGYEDLWMFGLLLDKTRLYDPYQGRYLSPDPVYNITGDPFDHNPYVFSKNNPFRNPDTFSKNNPFKKF